MKLGGFSFSIVDHGAEVLRRAGRGQAGLHERAGSRQPGIRLRRRWTRREVLFHRQRHIPAAARHTHV